MDDLYTQVGARIRELRLAKGLSQDALAAATHIHRSHVGAIETGAVNLTLQTLEPLALALDVSMEQLFKGVQLDPARLKARHASGPSRPAKRRSPRGKRSSGRGKNIPAHCKLIGENIRAIRQKRGLSQDDFESLTGLHRSHIGEIERGETNVTMATLTTVADALEVPLQKLMRGTNVAPRQARSTRTPRNRDRNPIV